MFMDCAELRVVEKLEIDFLGAWDWSGLIGLWKEIF